MWGNTCTPKQHPPSRSPRASSRGELIYLYLQIRGAATVDELKAELGIQLLTLYGTLKRLRRADLVQKVENQWTLEHRSGHSTAADT